MKILNERVTHRSSKECNNHRPLRSLVIHKDAERHIAAWGTVMRNFVSRPGVEVTLMVPP